MKLAKSSLVLLAIQLVAVCSIAAMYLYQRHACPNAWARAASFDPELPMRGRYLALQLTVDGCESTLPSSRQAIFGRNVDGSANQQPYSIRAQQYPLFPARLAVKQGKLIAVRVPAGHQSASDQMISALPGVSCESMRLSVPVEFFIAEHASSPLPLRPGSELWIDVTVPPQGPPRPLQLAIKQGSVWKPLAFQ